MSVVRCVSLLVVWGVLVSGVTPEVYAQSIEGHRVEREPFVPMPLAPEGGGGASMDWGAVWGLSMVGAGGVLGALGLVTLNGDGWGGTELGVTSLVSGVFVSGVGVYVLAMSGERSPRTILLRDPYRERSSWSWGVVSLGRGEGWVGVVSLDVD